MPKRKRTTEDLVLEQLTSGHTELSRALKSAKGLERQRLAKRLRDDSSGPEKLQRLEREVLVLKSLDLHQVAYAHLCSSVLRIKAAAESEQLPLEIKRGIAKPDLPEDERVALHNVTSSLYNRPEVRKVVEKAIAGICEALGVEVPVKKGKGKKKQDQGRDGVLKGEEPADRQAELPKKSKLQGPPTLDDAEKASHEAAPEDQEFAGFSDEEAEEAAFSRFDARLGGSSDEDDDGLDDDQDEDDLGDDISLPDSTSLLDSASDVADAPPPKRQAREKIKPGRPGESTFLPMLMGGYVDDSESEASEIEQEIQPRKNRRGQRERQQIWEMKYKEQAKHLQKQKDSRNAGWDMKRGAVDMGNKPWKQGVRTPFRQDRKEIAQHQMPAQPPAKAKEVTGALHPSWDAARKAKAKQKAAVFSGQKITFS